MSIFQNTVVNKYLKNQNEQVLSEKWTIYKGAEKEKNRAKFLGGGEMGRLLFVRTRKSCCNKISNTPNRQGNRCNGLQVV